MATLFLFYALLSLWKGEKEGGDVGEDLGGEGLADLAVFGHGTGRCVLQEVVEAGIGFRPGRPDVVADGGEVAVSVHLKVERAVDGKHRTLDLSEIRRGMDRQQFAEVVALRDLHALLERLDDTLII